jgi:5-methylcytosine-specific restriction endonuclease McrA
MKWTIEKIKSDLLKSSDKGVCTSTKLDPSLLTMARRKFGSFEKACEAAGVKSSSSTLVKFEKCKVEGCDKPLRSKQSGYCEMHYYRIRRTGNVTDSEGDTVEKYYDKCIHCGNSTEKGKKYCSQRCATRYLRNNAVKINCSVCCSLFEPLNKGIDNLECSDKCKEFRKKDRNISFSAKRRVSHPSLYDKNLDCTILMLMFSKCGICGHDIDKSLKFPNLDSMTIDHILPLSNGGSHTLSNVQLAHLKCNVKKHNN